MPKQKVSANYFLSVIVPAHRQEKTIARDLSRIKRVLEQLRYPFELICVVDGTVDRTFAQAQKFGERDGRVKVVGYESSHGKGHAIRFGMSRSKGDIIAYIDAGMDINPNGLSMALEHFEWYDADIIVGSKRHPVSKVEYPWQRKILSFAYQMLVRILFGFKVRDTQVGMKLFRREVLEKTLPRLLVKAYAFDVEMLAVAHYLGFKRLYEAPVELKLKFGDGSIITSKGFLKTIFLMLWDTLAVFYRLRILRYYSDENHRNWRFDPDLNFKVNIG